MGDFIKHGRITLALALALAPTLTHAAASQPELIAFEDVTNGIFWVATGNPTTRYFVGTGSFPAWSPDGTRLAYFRYKNNGASADLVIVNRSGQIVQEIDTGKAQAPAWSPDATEIAYGCTIPPAIGIDAICVVDVASEQARYIWTETVDDIWSFNLASLSWSPLGDRLVMTVEHKVPCADPESTATCRRMGVGSTTLDGTFQLLTEPSTAASSASYSPDGLKLAFYDRELGIRVSDSLGGSAMTIVPIEDVKAEGASGVSYTAWSPDGSEVLWSSALNGAQNGNDDFFSVQADGSGDYVHRVKDSNLNESPSWAPSIPACTIEGTPVDDELDGTEAGDVICGDSGNDTIDGKDGPDQIHGNTGGDDIVGGAGEDTIDGGAGDDVIAVADGETDQVTCGLGDDEVAADPDDDVAEDCETVVRGELLPVCGDVSGDRKISAGDALSTLRSAVGSGECEKCVCDVDDSDSITAGDALRILRAAVGQPVELGCVEC